MIHNRQLGLEEVRATMCNPRVDSHLVHLLRAMTAHELWRKQDHYATFIPGIDAYGSVALPYPRPHPTPLTIVSCGGERCQPALSPLSFLFMMNLAPPPLPPPSRLAPNACDTVAACVCSSAINWVHIKRGGRGGQRGGRAGARLSSMRECSHIAWEAEVK